MESTTRLTPIQSTVLTHAAARAKSNQSRLTLDDFTAYFRRHPKATAVPEAIYELLEQGLFAEYRDKKGHVVPKNYVVTDAGKDQAAWELANQDSPQERKSRAKMTGSAKRPPEDEQPEQADEWDEPAKGTPAKPTQRRTPAARPRATARPQAKAAAKTATRPKAAAAPTPDGDAP